MPKTVPAVRRTQEERSTETRTRLLDATIDCLVELGYSGTTTTEVAQRAGLSRGAQLHHFPTKAALVENAVAHLAHMMSEQYQEEIKKLPDTSDKVGATIDLMWTSTQGPLFAAVLELFVAARTDERLRPAVGRLQDVVRTELDRALREVFDGEVDRRTRLALQLTVAMTSGLALESLGGSLAGQETLLGAWKDMLLERTRPDGTAAGRA